MQKELLAQFQGKNVEIEFHNNFALRGYIDQISDDYFIFRTTQKTSMLHISQIKSIVPI